MQTHAFITSICGPVRWRVARIASLAMLLGSVSVSGRDLYVNREIGSDEADGFSPAVAGGSGPLVTIGAALARVQPGDTIRLAPGAEPYRETVQIRDLSGEPGNPIILDGGGATVSGADPLDPEEWTALGNGLYRNVAIPKRIRWDEAVEVRFFLFFGGRKQRMDRTSKGPRAPFKKPAELEPGEWTFVAAEQALYLRIAPGTDLEAADILVPTRRNGVAVHGDSSHWVIRNLTCREAINDGFSISPFGGQIRDLRFEEIRALDCGDDGISAHGDTEFAVDGFEASGNSTGICDTGNSRTSYHRAFIHGNFGMDVSFILEAGMQAPAWHAMSNSVVVSSAAATPFLAVSETPGPFLCEVDLEQVLFIGPPEGAVFQVGRQAALRARQVTWRQLDLSARGSSMEVTGSEIDARGGARILVGPESRWAAAGNRYGAAWVQVGKQRYAPEEAEPYRQATGDDSAWGPPAVADPEEGAPGAEIGRLPSHDPDLSAGRAGSLPDAFTERAVPPAEGGLFLRQDFADEETFPFSLAGRAGSRIRAGGRWSSFSEKGPAIVPGGAGAGRASLRLVRGGAWAMAETLLGVRHEGDYRLSLRLLREEGAGLAVTLRDAFGLDDAGLLIDDTGRVLLRHGPGSPAWKPAGLTVPANAWISVILETEGSAVRLSADGREGALSLPRQGAGFAPSVILMAPQGADGAVVLLDEVVLEAPADE